MWRSLPYWKQFPDPARFRARISPPHRAGDRERGGRFHRGTAGLGGHAGEAGSCCGCDPARPGLFARDTILSRPDRVEAVM